MNGDYIGSLVKLVSNVQYYTVSNIRNYNHRQDTNLFTFLILLCVLFLARTFNDYEDFYPILFYMALV